MHRQAAMLVVLLVLAGCTNAVRDGERPVAATASAGSSQPMAAGDIVPQVQDAIGDAATGVQQAIEDPASDVIRATAAVITPVVLDVTNVVQEALPSLPQPPVGISEEGAARIAKHEIISASYYERKFQGIACPGETSGPTCGIGCDLGMQTRATIGAWWADHPQVSTLQDGSGVRGFAGCRSFRNHNADVRTPYALALRVYREHMLPVYWDQAANAYRNGWAELPQRAKDGLTDTTYVRGGSTKPRPNSKGQDTRREIVAIAKVCVPAGDIACIADQHRRMCWVWAGRKDGAGLCNRMRATADYIEGKA